jgi:endonuclease/exonuclease/phosphatase family metal-dependent hydrolase
MLISFLMKTFLKVVIAVILVPVVILIGIILYATVSDYHPAEKEAMALKHITPDTLPDTVSVRVLIWNIGYCGLDYNMDFFYDGGRGVRTPELQFLTNYNGVLEQLNRTDSADFILLQEVDVRSKRSYRTNEVEGLKQALKGFDSYFARNYDVFFVPVPFSRPMGSVNSGLLSFSRCNPSLVTMYTFPGQYAWPKRLFMLDRCFLVMRYALDNGKELLVINTHNEAYDNGSIRDTQMAYLHDFLLSEYQRGNYIITGGDWNQCPPDFIPKFNGQVFDSVNFKGIGADYLPPDWTWLFDNKIPSNRRIDIPYNKGVTKTTVIDFFLLSPNLEPVECRTFDLDFEFSDHQPVFMHVKLK